MPHRHRRVAIAATFAAAALSASVIAAAAGEKKAVDPLRERGRYLATIAGCHDCHTPGFAMSGGKADEKQWLIGDSLGWRGPWGTTYPVNLREYMQHISEKDWVARAKTLQARPPMPWVVLNAMTDTDLRALHRFIRSLGPAG